MNLTVSVILQMHSQLNGAQSNDEAALKYYDTLKFQIFHLALNNYVWSDVRRVLAYAGERRCVNMSRTLMRQAN